MFHPITKSSLILCLTLIPVVWPQATRPIEDLYKEIFSDQTSQSSVQSSTTSTVSKNKGSGAESGTVCQTDAGEDGICMSKDECNPPWLSDLRQTGNCIGFLEICCPNEATQVEVTVPTLILRKSVVCGRRQPGGLAVKANDKKLEFAYFGEFPWMVGVLNNQVSDDGVWNSNTYQGGGTLIGPRAVLTAAHVVREFVLDGSPLKVRAGESDTEKDDHYPYVESPVQTIIMHEQFNHENLRNDIALLILKEPINANAYIGYACLPTQGQEAPIVKNCLATGWGKDQFGREGRLQHKLKKIQLPIVPNDKCQERLRESRLGEFFKLHSSFLCAGGETGPDTCEGDGGSPLICPIPDVQLRYTQHGIVAAGVDCAYGSYPGIYANVAKFRDWIDNKMRRENLDTSTYNF